MQWLAFEFLRWLSGAPVQAHLQLRLRDAGGHPWSTRTPISDLLWAWLVLLVLLLSVTAWGFSAVPSVWKVVKLQVALDWAVRKGSRGEDGEDWLRGCSVGLESWLPVLPLLCRDRKSPGIYLPFLCILT